MLLLAFWTLGVAGLDASRNYVETGGGIFGDACTGDGIQKYKYNGKELDRTHGLDTYDYGARMYDAALPVWDRPDPLAHKYYHISPYAYCGNNPIVRIDRDGRIWDTVIDLGFIAYDIADAATQYLNTGSVSSTTRAALGADALAAVIPGVTGAGIAVRTGEKAASRAVEIGHGLKNAKAIAEGRAFEKGELAAAKANGENVAGQIRLVPKNGIGNVKLNRSTVDQLIKKDSGNFKVVENKLRKGSSKMSKGQQTIEKHAKYGNKLFEVRSKNQELGLNKGQLIKIDEYKIRYKYYSK